MKPDHAFFRLEKKLVILSDGCRRFDFARRGTCIDARDFYRSEYLEGITWLGPFHCKIGCNEFISLKNEGKFEIRDIVATIDSDYYWINSPLYDGNDYDDERFLDNLM